MGKQKGLIQVEGSMGNLSFYSSVYGDIVRRKGGATKQMIRTSPQFERLRENQAEFSKCAAAGKLLRQTLKIYTREAPDHRLVWRVTALMNQLKALDPVGKRGERVVSQGLARPEGVAMLMGFELNSQAPLDSVLKGRYSCQGGRISLPDLVPAQDLKAPKGATHARLRAIVQDLEFDADNARVYSAEQTVALTNSLQAVDLMPALNAQQGMLVCSLQICFLQEVNGVLYALEDKKGNCMRIVEVG